MTKCKESKTNKTTLRVIFAAAVVLLFCSAVIGVVGAATNVADATALQDTLGGPTCADLTDSTVMLKKNVTLSDELIIKDTITLNLGGYVITAPDGKRAFTVDTGASFTVTDTTSTENNFVMNQGGKWIHVTSSPADYKLAQIHANPSLIADGKCVSILGGCIIGGSAKNGGGVYVGNDGKFTMSGNASIVGNSADYGGGVYVAEYGKFTMSGNTNIVGNSASDYGGGVYVDNDGTFNVSGTPFIKNNTLTSGDQNNVVLYNATQLALTGSFTGDIRVSLIEGYSASKNNKFGIAKSGTADDAAHFFNDDGTLCGTINDAKLFWKLSPVAKVTVFGGETNEYETFAEAWDAATTNHAVDQVTVKLLADVVTTNTLVVLGNSGSGSLTLDLNGKVLQRNGGGSVIIVASNGNLTVENGTSSTPHWFEYAEVGAPWTLYTGAIPTGNNVKVYDSLAEFDRTDADNFLSTSGNKVYTNVTSGCITGGNVHGRGGGVFVYDGGTFEMSGGSIVGNNAEGDGGGVFVGRGSMFEMSSGSIVGNSAQFGGGVCTYDNGTFEMSGGSITGNNACYGGGVCVNGEFIMSGGSITGNGANEGSSVFVNGGGRFSMFDGSITGNNAYYGGGVAAYGQFEMSGTANITGNNATMGGGVAVMGGTFDMSGNANITGNRADKGGGVYVTCGLRVDYNGTFTMKGGSITENSASQCGGVYVSEYGKFTMSDGIITQNTPNDVYLKEYSSLGETHVSGSSSSGGSFV